MRIKFKLLSFVFVSATLPLASAGTTQASEMCTVRTAKQSVSSNTLCACDVVSSRMLKYIQRRADFESILARTSIDCPAFAAVLTDLPTASIGFADQRSGDGAADENPGNGGPSDSDNPGGDDPDGGNPDGDNPGGDNDPKGGEDSDEDEIPNDKPKSDDETDPVTKKERREKRAAAREKREKARDLMEQARQHRELAESEQSWNPESAEHHREAARKLRENARSLRQGAREIRAELGIERPRRVANSERSKRQTEARERREARLREDEFGN